MIERFGPDAPALANPLDDHTIYFNPSLLSPEYAAHVGEDPSALLRTGLLAAAPRVLDVQRLPGSLEDLEKVFAGEEIDVSGRLQIAEASP